MVDSMAELTYSELLEIPENHSMNCGAIHVDETAVVSLDYPERCDCAVADLVGALRALERAQAKLATIDTEWADGLTNNGEFEFTTTSHCDGSNLRQWKRTPAHSAKAGPWLPA